MRTLFLYTHSSSGCYDTLHGRTIDSSLRVTEAEPRGKSERVRATKVPFLPFMEACVIRVPIDPPGLRRKLDLQWMKGIWVGRLDESDGHVVLTTHGTGSGRTVRRLAGHLRVQPDLVGKIKSHVQDPALSQAELLKVLPASVPIRLPGETDTDQLAEEQDRAAQREQMEGIVDERVRAEITRPLRSAED